MKSIVMAVLLIAAVGAGVYFLFLNKKKTEIGSNYIEKELIVGKWKLDSLAYLNDPGTFLSALSPVIDSNFANYVYQFQQDGKVLRLFRDTVQKDTSRYEWLTENNLLLKQANDSAGTKFIVSKLSIDSLVLQSKDSTIAFFTKTKS